MLIAVAVRRPLAVWDVMDALIQKVGTCSEEYIECFPFRAEDSYL